jgi:hypothetical protein
VRASSLTLAAALAVGALAHAQPAPLPAAAAEAARAAFAEAQAADDRGDLATAIERYRFVQKIAPHPNVTYNLADVLRRKHDVRGAIREYRAYLEAAPAAPDRVKVEKVLAGLEAIKGDVDVTSDAPDAVIFIDGVRQAGPPPIFLEMAPGAHRFDAITPLSFRSDVELVEPTGKHVARLAPPTRVDGNLVVSGTGWLDRADLTVDGGKDRHRLAARLPVAPGKRTLTITFGACAWSKAVVAPAKGVTYVYLTVAGAPPPPPPRGAPKPAPPPCAKGTFAVKKLAFPPRP